MTALAGVALGALLRRTPGSRMGTRTGLRVLASGIVALIATLGVIATWSAADQDSAMQHAATRAEPLSIAAEDIYRDLSDADATAAQVFLSGAQAGTADQQRYDTDVRHVSAGLAAVSADGGSSAALRDATGEIVADLPVYTRLVGTAQADSRQNLPVGAAYLREASVLLRGRLLPAARQALAQETGLLAGDGSAAAADPQAEIAVAAVVLAALGLAQVFLVRRTNRLVNPGIAAAALLVAVLALWVGFATPAERGAVAAAGTHRQTADALVATELAVIQAHGDELLGLAARGEDVGGYEHDFTTTSASVTRMLDAERGTRIADATAAYGQWLNDHKALVQLETDPQADNSANAAALASVTGSVPSAGGGAFARVDADLRGAVADEESAYLAAIDAGESDLDGLAAGAAVIGVAALAVGVFGINQRLKDFR